MPQIYDTLSEQKKDIKKPRKGFLKMFVCGPTVYDEPHIGHAKTYIVFDCFSRYLQSRGYKLFYLQNVTDIDDKIINQAKKENKPPKKIADFYYHDYLKNMKLLGIKSVNKYAKATDYIKEIKNQINGLLKLEFAYKTSSGIYFEVKKFKDYGRLSKQDLDELRPGYRIEPDPKKKDPLDFALWKFQNKKEFGWPSPWGWGRPGWHIEDTAITEKYFGPQYDIHGGGADLKFPHHEAEIAQQETASGKKPFVEIWMHTGALLVNGQKMSKSLKNFISIKDFLKKYSSDVLRMVISSHHYRSSLDYNEGMALQAERSLKTIREFLTKLSHVKNSHTVSIGESKNTIAPRIINFIKGAGAEFESALNDDFNTPQALATVFNLINEINKAVWQLDKRTARETEKFIAKSLKIFGFQIKAPKIPGKIKQLIDKRESLRRNEQFIPADLLRKKIESLGYIVEDTPLGPMILMR